MAEGKGQWTGSRATLETSLRFDVPVCQVDLLELQLLRPMAPLASPAPSLPPAPDLDPDPDPDPDGLHPHEEQYVSEAEASLLPTQPELPACRDAETITDRTFKRPACSTRQQYIEVCPPCPLCADVCNSTDLPEFEIISLLEEQLPVYRLRADTVYGYDHDDWLHTPLVAPDTRIDLTTEQIEETLKYFLLCADRVGQMTKTYNDIDAVTRLLEEKERDLELAARIGQSLLKKNRTLTEQNDYLEERVGQITEEDELLQFYTNTVEESEDESSSSPTGKRSQVEIAPGGTLQRKLKELEEENLSLRSEANHLKSETETYEEKEQQLVNDCVKELRMSSLQINTIAEELARKTEDASRQQEDITHLLSQLVDLQKKTKTLKMPKGSSHWRVHRRRVFETVKNVNQTVRQRSLTPTSNIPGSNQSLSARTSPQSSGLSTPYSSMYGGDVSGDSVALDNRTQSILMEKAANQDSSSEGREKKAAGAEDLRLALRRLSLRRQNNLSERRFFEEERVRKRGGNEGLHDAMGQESGMTPSESIMSLGNLHLWASRGPYLPDKLQIVKPLEGSATLHHWQQLAQPHLGVILDARPGVVPKGYRPLELELEQVYPWGGFEEEEPGEQYFQNLPTSSASASPAVPPTSTTAVTSIGQPPTPILTPPSPPSPSPSPHLSNLDALADPGHTQSEPHLVVLLCDDQLSVGDPCCDALHPPQAQPHAVRILHQPQARDATRTTSTSLGLVRLLQERGISAAMYHQSQGLEYGQGNGGVLFSTSVNPNRAPNPDPLRPCTLPNSPTGPGASAVPTSAGFDFKSPSYDNFLTSRPARSILKEVTGRMRGRQRGRDCESQTDVSVTVHNLNLLDKVKRGGTMSPGPILGPLGGLRRSGSPFGPDGMRRNRSYPAMVGASMAMKGPGPQE
ncbi:hypothetical protein F7725_024874 [Dissostichus mawsoni]|uniref:Trafficking kinesin-binding protein 1-like n=1 Tax=Dissostichus mawsoni TaxID=36200 RepID=A0A7J5X9I4_DISMA|nr:hypothetical protein F7725_024874 [Dissostichus mawsoni]